jgi:hypothetical protein
VLLLNFGAEEGVERVVVTSLDKLKFTPAMFAMQIAKNSMVARQIPVNFCLSGYNFLFSSLSHLFFWCLLFPASCVDVVCCVCVVFVCNPRTVVTNLKSPHYGAIEISYEPARQGPHFTTWGVK